MRRLWASDVMLHEKYWAQLALRVILNSLHCNPSPICTPKYHKCSEAWFLWGKWTESSGPLSCLPSPLRPQDLGQPWPKHKAIANIPLHYTYGWQGFGETGIARVKRKTNLGLWGPSGSQPTCFVVAKGNWRNGKHLKGRACFVFFLGEGFSL